MKLLRRHRCRSSVVLEVRINGQTIVGPVDAEQLGLIARYGGGRADEPFDLMDYSLLGDIRRVEILATYKPGAG